MTVSICPTFYCNCHCDYCYLGNKTYDTLLLNIDKLDLNLHMLENEHVQISRIEIFGGDISLLDDNYLHKLQHICKKHCKDVNAISNVSRSIFHIFDDVSFSLNTERLDYAQTLAYISSVDHDFSLNVVVLPSIVKLHKDGLLANYLKQLPNNCKSVFFIKYSDSAAARKHYVVDDIEYEAVVLEACKILKHTSIRCQNAYDLKNYDPLMSANVFILPNANFAWICYDENNREYFKQSCSLNVYFDACKNEYNLYVLKCSTCEYFKHCYTEHLNFNLECSGHKRLKKAFDENDLLKADKLMQFML